ncbi:MAG: amidohydrolase family protein [Flavobacterium sp.]|nr:amidohydrolase family protein [Pedobacter sp.]
MKTIFLLVLFSLAIKNADAQTSYLLKADRVFDGVIMHDQWVVLVSGEQIEAIGPVGKIKVGVSTKIIELKGQTLLPGLIEGHSHVLLHPYNETSWDDQVLKESRVERTVRATSHLQKTLMAGFTTIRDLGTEGAGYDDVGLKQSIEKGLISGPRMLVAGPAIVATGSYGPKSNVTAIKLINGAEEADDQNIVKVVRDQIGHGVDMVKIYADYGWGINDSIQPTFLEEEIRKAVLTAKSSGRGVVAHASSVEGMRRAILAGVETIEHGDNGTLEIFKLMKEKNVAFCPTLAAGDAVLQYKGWKKGTEPEPQRIIEKRASFKLALKAEVTICMGGDVGVFSHGDNAKEMEMMVDYGMKPIDVLRSATSVNADVFHIAKQVGRIKTNLIADLIAVNGNPAENMSAIRQVTMVIKSGKIVKE